MGDKVKNTLWDLNNHLFAQLERLGDEELTGDKLQEEISRAKSISDIATRVIANGSLVLNSKKFMHDSYDADKNLPKMLEGEKCTDSPDSQGSGSASKKKIPDKSRAEYGS